MDGVILEGTLADINSEDIQNMEILKGSAASSLYGSRAANGVIQIFTKRGNANIGTNVKVRSEYGISYIPEKRLPRIAQHHNYQLDSSGNFLLDDAGGLQLESDGIIDNDFPNYFNSIDRFYKSNDFHSEYVAITNRTENSNALISFQVTNQGGTNQLITFYASQDNGGRQGDITLQDGFFNLFDDRANDVRAAFTYISPDNGGILTSKYTNQFGNVPVLRLAEMHLIRAEANFREGSSVGNSPLDDINLIRARSKAS